MRSTDPIRQNALDALALLMTLELTRATDQQGAQIKLMQLIRLHIVGTFTRLNAADKETLDKLFGKICSRLGIEPISVDYKKKQ